MEKNEQIIVESPDRDSSILARIPTAQAEEDRLAWNMVEHNKIDGILPFEYYYLNDLVCFRYDLSGYQPVSSFLEKETADFALLFWLCREIVQILERGALFFLKEKDFLLKPEWIFWDFDKKKLVLCYLPGRIPEKKRELIQLLEYLLKHLDHKDKRASALLYGMYEFCAEDSKGMEEIREYIEEERWDETKKSEQPLPASYPEHTLDQGRTAEKADTADKQNRIFRIGRDETSDLFIPFGTVSRNHLQIIEKEGTYFIMDLASKNGTWLNGRKLPAMQQVAYTEKDVIRIAGISFRLHSTAAGLRAEVSALPSVVPGMP